VISRIGHLLLICALLGASGGHWAVLQSVAWAKMLADNSRTECLSTAIEKTFDGKHLCPLCQQIAKGRQSEKKADAQLELKKLEFLPQQTALFVQSPAHFILLGAFNSAGQLLTQTPPVPPPRSLAG
jgi:hypothetical protein